MSPVNAAIPQLSPDKLTITVSSGLSVPVASLIVLSFTVGLPGTGLSQRCIHKMHVLAKPAGQLTTGI